VFHRTQKFLYFNPSFIYHHMIYLLALIYHFNFYFISQSHLTSNSSGYHISYLATAYNKESKHSSVQRWKYKPLSYTIHLSPITSITTIKIKRMLREKIFSHLLSTKFTILTTSIHTPIALQYKLTNYRNEISFVQKPLITHELFLVILIYVLSEDGFFALKHTV